MAVWVVSWFYSTNDEIEGVHESTGHAVFALRKEAFEYARRELADWTRVPPSELFELDRKAWCLEKWNAYITDY